MRSSTVRPTHERFFFNQRVGGATVDVLSYWNKSAIHFFCDFSSSEEFVFFSTNKAFPFLFFSFLCGVSTTVSSTYESDSTSTVYCDALWW